MYRVNDETVKVNYDFEEFTKKNLYLKTPCLLTLFPRMYVNVFYFTLTYSGKNTMFLVSSPKSKIEKPEIDL